MSTQPFDQINFSGRDWVLLHQHLEKELDTAISIMCQTGIDHDEVNRLRGKILFINTMLYRAERLQKDAANHG